MNTLRYDTLLPILRIGHGRHASKREFKNSEERGSKVNKGVLPIRVGSNYKVPESAKGFFKPKSAHRHINSYEIEGTRSERIVLHLNEELTEKEKGRFSELLHDQHIDWFGCACWGKLSVRISLRYRDSQQLANARLDAPGEADRVLEEILSSRR